MVFETNWHHLMWNSFCKHHRLLAWILHTSTSSNILHRAGRAGIWLLKIHFSSLQVSLNTPIGGHTEASALISSWLDYANSILYGSPSKNIARLQRAQKHCSKSCYIKTITLVFLINTLHKLHWLAVQWSIKFKLACLAFKVMHTGTPLHLSRLLIPYFPHILRSSSSSNLLQVPSLHLLTYLHHAHLM